MTDPILPKLYKCYEKGILTSSETDALISCIAAYNLAVRSKDNRLRKAIDIGNTRTKQHTGSNPSDLINDWIKELNEGPSDEDAVSPDRN